MRLEIGAGGKIIGTKRVSANGQVSGLSEFAGQEVLVILPGTDVQDNMFGSGSGVSSSGQAGEEMLQEFQRAAYDHIRLAYRQYKELQDQYGSPAEATLEFLRNAAPGTFEDFLGQVEKWVIEQAGNAPSGDDVSNDSDTVGTEVKKEGTEKAPSVSKPRKKPAARKKKMKGGKS